MMEKSSKISFQSLTFPQILLVLLSSFTLQTFQMAVSEVEDGSGSTNKDQSGSVSSLNDTLPSEERDLDYNNCFSLLTPTEWDMVLNYEEDLARLKLNLMGFNKTSNAFSNCLSQNNSSVQNAVYKVELIRMQQPGEQIVQTSKQAMAENLLSSDVTLNYILLPGEYFARFQICHLLLNLTNILCSEEPNDIVESPTVAKLNQTLISESCDGDQEWSSEATELDEAKGSLLFDLTFPSCESPLVKVYPGNPVAILLRTKNSSTECMMTASEPNNEVVENKVVVMKEKRGNYTRLKYRTGPLQGGHYYCVIVSHQDHLVCQENVTSSRPHICEMSSFWIYVETRPFIADYIPYCSSHFKCGWIYLTALLSLVLTLSCLFAVCCIHCCCCCKKNKKMRRLSSGGKDDSIPFEGLCLTDGPSAPMPKKTWLELHKEWDTEPPKNPGKILLLYSPDSKLFKNLQTALKSFLEEACHCIVLDLFDEELFQSIAFDPELWLSNLLEDPDFKIIVICSEGAYKRQEALLKGEVLNIPDNNSMDGLFSSGLKFIQTQHAYDYNRLALARYEMLHLTSPEFRLEEMVPNREFLVPTQLHDLFCWIHGYDPLDLLGKPWDRYHLEWQLLTDALKQVRMERR